jgi:hypothetical protein
MYSSSKDGGQSFSTPELIAKVRDLSASHTRGPQVAVLDHGVVVIAGNHKGDIFSFAKMENGNWSDPVRINDVDIIAKEQFMAFAAGGSIPIAILLDLREKHIAIYISISLDVGISWSKNMLIYDSPDGTVCECCKPSLAMKDNRIYVMFRNWLRGSRDLYLVQSNDAGHSFGEAKKLGNESWKLDACPMDGGNLVLDDEGPQTVWLRKSTIYACTPGQAETALGEGRSCTVESTKGKEFYAWSEKGNVIILKNQMKKILVGVGSQPQIKSIEDGKIVCIWENQDQIHKAVVGL